MDPPRRPELQRSKTLDPSSPSLTTSRTVLDDITGRINLAGGPSLRVAPAFVEETEELDRTRLLTPRSRSFGLRVSAFALLSSIHASAGSGEALASFKLGVTCET